MRLFIGILFTVVGGVVAVVGLLGALGELVGMYSSALNDAMADGPEGKAVGASMMRWAVIGATGVPFLLVGSVMLKISMFQKMRRMARGGALVAQMPAQAAMRKPGAGRVPGSAQGSGQGPAAADSQWEVARDRSAKDRVSAPPARGTPRREDLGESGGNKSER
jgi:hypothetical protein